MKGKFIGKDSMGFKHGVIYDIRSDLRVVRKHDIFSDDIISICIYDNHSDAWCPYSSLEAILRNWKIIQ